MELRDIISINLRKKAKEKGFTQVKISELTGISKTALGHYFTGENLPSIDNLISICDLLNCTIDEIVGRLNQESYIAEILKDNELKEILLFLKNNPSIKEIIIKICK